MNLMTTVTSYFKRPREPHEPHPALWVVTAVVLALLGTAAALVRNLDDEPKLAMGKSALGYVIELISPDTNAAATSAATSVQPLRPRR